MFTVVKIDQHIIMPQLMLSIFINTPVLKRLSIDLSQCPTMKFLMSENICYFLLQLYNLHIELDIWHMERNLQRSALMNILCDAFSLDPSAKQ